MGSNTPKTTLDREYRELAARFLEGVMDRRKLKKGDLAKALGVDRSVASRYLTRDVRPPLHRLQFLNRTLGEELPEEIVEAFWASEASAQQPPPVPVDIENAIRSLGDQLREATSDETKAQAKRQLQTLIRQLG